ncbi:unnamed protein product [Adineta ricciae]|uniref:Uncharacterized protein n=1 Tax=Adineta ricciae TaxID=249248 RepID=A0A814VAC7_ADIRI|nr:unnamed protein product [Adineta ricciae]CAF1376527.1 unnamed protein product [Adineta ricciae]
MSSTDSIQLTQPTTTSDDCSICLNSLTSNSILLTLTCNHRFHLQCLASNIQARNNVCPLCRSAIDATAVQLLAGVTHPPQTLPLYSPSPPPHIPIRPHSVPTIPSVEDPVDETAVQALTDRVSSARQAAATAASADTPTDRPTITATTTLEYCAQPLQPASNIYGLVTLQAPSQIISLNDASSTPTRVPIDLVCVVDQSGSMAGDKLTLLRQTLVYITEQLNDLDRLAIVSFDTRAYDRSHGLKRMNPQNQQTLTNAINNDIVDGGGTFIGCGLKMGIDLLKDRQTKNPIAALLLLTDGQDNRSHDYTELLSTLPADVLCHTFGYGPDHMANLLVKIAETGNNGSFTYIDQEQAVGAAFAVTLGGLFSCVAKQIQVRIELNGQYTITDIHSKYPYEPTALPSNKLTVKFNDLNADEKRNLIFQLHVPEVEESQTIDMNSQNAMSQDVQLADVPSVIGHVSVTYTDPNNDQIVTTLPVPFELIRAAAPTTEQLQVNYTLDLQRNRVETARGLKRAMDEGDYHRSRNILKDQVKKIKASVSGNDPFCRSLIQDLAHHYPSENAYRSSHNNTYMQHSSERGTYTPTTTLSSLMYQNRCQRRQARHFQQQVQMQQPPVQLQSQQQQQQQQPMPVEPPSQQEQKPDEQNNDQI